MSRLPDPLPPEGDDWWLSSPIGLVLEARVLLWVREMGMPDSGVESFMPAESAE